MQQPSNIQPAPLAAVFFDLGGTLFEHLESTTSEQNLLTAWQSLLADLPAGLQRDLDGGQFVLDYRHLRQRLEQAFVAKPFFLHRELVAASFVQAVQNQAAAQSLTVELLNQHAHSFCAAQRDSVIQNLQPRPDMAATLTTLSAMGLVLGIVSNIDDDYLQPLARKHQLHRHFQFCLSSQAAQSCKPDRQIFALACDQVAHDLLPAAVLFVGDSAAHDICGANRAGMRSCLLAPAVAQQQPLTASEFQPDYRVSELAELPAIARSLSER